MANTTDHVSGRLTLVEVSTDGTTWVDISGSSTTVGEGDQSRETEDTPTFGSDVPIVTGGGKGKMEVAVGILYTDNATEAFEVVRAVHEANNPIYFRYSPGGGNTGDAMFTAADGDGNPTACVISNFKYPGTDASVRTPVRAGFTLSVPAYRKSEVL